MIGTELHRYYEGRYVIDDGESEGLTLWYNKPFQWAWAIADNKRIIEIKTRYIHWDNLNMSADAARITRFNRLEWARQAKPAKEVLDEYEADLYNPAHRNVRHNGLGFDTYLHSYWRHLCGKPRDYSYVGRSIDTNCLMKAYFKGIKPDTAHPLAWQYKMQNLIEKGLKTNLAVSCKTFGIEFDEGRAHEAGYDIVKTHEIFKELLYKIEF